MPILFPVTEGDTDAIVFPLLQDGQAMNLATFTYAALVRSGFDGKLTASVTSGSAVAIYDQPGGLVKWNQGSTDLDARYGPYRVYFRLYNADGTYIIAPRGDYFLLLVSDDLV